MSKAKHALNQPPSRSFWVRTAWLWPLLVFVAAVLFEGLIVGFFNIMVATHWLHTPWLGQFINWELFVIGGYWLANYEFKHTVPNRPLDRSSRFGRLIDWFFCEPMSTMLNSTRTHDPILWTGRVLNRLPEPLALVLNSLLVAPMYVGVVMKYDQHTWKPQLYMVWSSIIYATAWIPLLTYVWK